MTTTTHPCTCRGYDPADPCGHGDTSEGCLAHDPHHLPDEMIDTPIAWHVDWLQGRGFDVMIVAWSDDLRYALIVDADNGSVSVAPKHACNGIGRWECGKAHYEHNIDHYHRRFPRR